MKIDPSISTTSFAFIDQEGYYNDAEDYSTSASEDRNPRKTSP